MLVRRYTEYTATQRDDFLFGNTCGILINKEIELHLTTVDMTVVVHYHGLNTAANHFANNLSYANRLLPNIFALELCIGIVHLEHDFLSVFPTSIGTGYQLFLDASAIYAQYAPLWVSTAPTVRNSNTTSPNMDQFCT